MLSEADQIRLFKALSDSTRYTILKLLIKKEYCANDIVAHCNKSQPTVSLHLKFLELSGVIQSRKIGRQVLYSLADMRVKKLIKVMDS